MCVNDDNVEALQKLESKEYYV